MGIHQGLLVAHAEHLDGAQRLDGRNAQGVQHFLGKAQAGMKGLADEAVDVAVDQQMGMAAIAGADEDLEMGKMALHHVGDEQRLLHVVERDHISFAVSAPAARSRSGRLGSP